MSVIGFVEKVSTKSGTSARGPWTLYSLRLQDKGGDMLPGYYQCGFDSPGCKEGDYVKLEAAAKGDNWDVQKGSVRVSKNPPAKPAAPEAPQGGGGAGGKKSYGGPKTKSSELFGEIGGYNTEDDIRRMSYSAARDHAIRVVGLLVDKGGIKLVKAESKAGAAKCFDLITGSVDKLTVEYFYDSATGRKLETVADKITDTEGDGELPDSKPDVDDFEADDFESEEGAPDDDGFE